jgi:hypothetical protein
MITLQEETTVDDITTPEVVWDDTTTNLYDQTSEAQIWIDENLRNVAPTISNETVMTSYDVELVRPLSYTYTNSEFTLVEAMTYRNGDDCSLLKATYDLTIN